MEITEQNNLEAQDQQKDSTKSQEIIQENPSQETSEEVQADAPIEKENIEEKKGTEEKEAKEAEVKAELTEEIAADKVADDAVAEEAVTEETIVEEAVTEETVAEENTPEKDLVEEPKTDADSTSEVIKIEKEQQEKLEKESESLDKIAAEVGLDEEDETEENEEEEISKYASMEMEQLIDILNDLVTIENVNSIKNKVIGIRTAFIEKIKEFKKQHKADFLKEGKPIEDYRLDDGGLQNKFNLAFNVYKKKHKEFIEAQEILKENNLKRKNEILEELRQLIDSEDSLKKIYDEFRNLQEKWREIGIVPKGEMKNLWMNYNFLVDKFFDKVKIDHELRDMGYQKNLKAKIELAEKAEELLLEKSITTSFKLLQDYHRKWKEIGPVPHDKSEEIWERFKSATEKVNERRRAYYSSLEEEQKNNLVLKTELVEKAQQITTDDIKSSKVWNTRTEAFQKLFEEWRKIGPAPKKHNDEIWGQFKGAMNNFYAQKKKYFGKLKDEQTENYQKKLDLCKTAESIQDSTDWKNTTHELINLQKEWQKIGPVQKKHSEKVWKRFRAACDHFFNAKEAYFKNIKNEEKDNLDKKKALIETIKTQSFSEDKETALNEMKELQKQWIEIGQVPYKMKDKIYREYRNAVDDKLSEIGLSAVDLELLKLKEKVGGASNPKETEFIIRKEMNGLKSKIDKIQAEITQYENNMGFFASSRNSDTLIKEFKDKIENSRKTIKRLKAKMNQLDKTLRIYREEQNA